MSETDRLLAINQKLQTVTNKESCKFILWDFQEGGLASAGSLVANVEIEPIQMGKVSVVILEPVNTYFAELTCDLLVDGEVAVEDVFFEPMNCLTTDLPTYKTNLFSGGASHGIIPINCTLRFKLVNGGLITDGTILIIVDYRKLNEEDRIINYSYE